MNNKFIFTALLIVAVIFSAFSAGQADTADPSAWPTKPINLIVPAGAGGGTDLGARLIAKYLSEELGRPVNVTNIGGASGSIGMREVLNSAPDGYTFSFFLETTVANDVLGVANFGYRDFDLVANVTRLPMVLVGSSNITDVETLTRLAKQAPGEVIWAGESGGFISMLPHIMEQQLGIDLRIVDGGQMAERLVLMVGNQINLTWSPLSVVDDYIARGDLSVVAYFGDSRLDSRPEIPTAVEQGLDVVYNRFQHILAPKGVDPAIIARFNEALLRISQNPEFINEATSRNIIVAYEDPEGLRGLLEGFDTDLRRFVELLR